MKRTETVPDVISKLLVTQTYVTSSEVATAAHVTRQAAHYHLSRMAESGLLVHEGARRSSRYRSNAQRSARYAIEGRSEHEVWGAEKPALGELAPGALGTRLS